MIAGALASGIHVFGITVALSTVLWRGVALRHVADGRPEALASALRADNIWGFSALLMWGSGLWRAFGGLEKGITFYEHNGLFFIKLGVLAVMMLLESVPMLSLIRWRLRRADAVDFDVDIARRLSAVSLAEASLIVLVIFVAPFMARGAWMLS